MPDRTTEMKLRVEAKKKEIEQKLTQLRAEAHGTKNDEIEQLEQQLNEINSLVKDGWDNLSETVVEKLNSILK